jgi:uncharacterized protein
MTHYKIIFTGPVGSGKTTAISALSDTPVLNTDEIASDMTRNRKPTTTVAMDFGVMKLDGDDQVLLYGTPGQERFDFMWEILVEGGLGLILLLDNSRDNALKDLDFYLAAFRAFIDKTELVIGVTRTEAHPRPSLGAYQTCLQQHGLSFPVFEVDARKRADVAMLVRALLYRIDPAVALDTRQTGENST